MDGFALRASDTAAETDTVTLMLCGTVQAGTGNLPTIGPGEAARIMTGAPIPPGADTVVPFEDTRFDDRTVTVPAHRAAGACVRPAGLDVKKGDLLLPSGTRMGPAQIALAASVGIDHVKVYRRPVVAILATGDELVEPGTPLGLGQIYNSNAHGLTAAVTALGAIPTALRPARDDPEALAETLTSIQGVDLILTSGGVSVGDFDYVKSVVGQHGSVDFWRVRMRPGKPLMFGSLASSGGSPTLILGLPGNPTSTMVTFFVFAQPMILKLMGSRQCLPDPVWATASDSIDNRGGRETYFRVRLAYVDGRPEINLSGGQDSSMLLPLARANALARVPAEIDSIDPGDLVEVFLLS